MRQPVEDQPRISVRRGYLTSSLVFARNPHLNQLVFLRSKGQSVYTRINRYTRVPGVVYPGRAENGNTYWRGKIEGATSKKNAFIERFQGRPKGDHGPGDSHSPDRLRGGGLGFRFCGS